jgi:hypothetical protein
MPGNAPLVRAALSGAGGVAVVELPFTKSQAAECVEDLPSLSAFPAFTVPEFPHVQLTLADITAPFNDPALTGPFRAMDAKITKGIADSHGLIVNTFDAMESHYTLDWNMHVGPKAWPIGPLCLARPPPTSRHGGAPSWMRWLDEKAAAGRAVLYVALGIFMAVPEAQLREVANGLERSGLDFLWAVRPVDVVLSAGFEERVRGRGLVVREWVDQCAILEHGCVRGFLSHCGWNSMLESICAGGVADGRGAAAQREASRRRAEDRVEGVGCRERRRHGDERAGIRRGDRGGGEGAVGRGVGRGDSEERGCDGRKSARGDGSGRVFVDGAEGADQRAQPLAGRRRERGSVENESTPRCRSPSRAALILTAAAAS